MKIDVFIDEKEWQPSKILSDVEYIRFEEKFPVTPKTVFDLLEHNNTFSIASTGQRVDNGYFVGYGYVPEELDYDSSEAIITKEVLFRTKNSLLASIIIVYSEKIRNLSKEARADGKPKMCHL